MIEIRDVNKESVRLAAALLLNDGRISITEIGALPLVENKQEALLIAQKLYDAFSKEYEVVIEGGDWLVLKPKPAFPKRRRGHLSADARRQTG